MLDCTNYESARSSLAAQFGCSSEDLANWLLSTDWEAQWEIHSHDMPFSDYLYEKAIEDFRHEPAFEKVAWFHLTRTHPDNEFTHGILPLGQVINPIWEILIAGLRDTLQQEQLRELKSKGTIDFQYNLKSPNPIHWGPFGVLVRETAFAPREVAAHDYLRLPEIIEDICNGYRRIYDISIHEEVIAFLRPCIVKFQADSETGYIRNCIRAAICYTLCRSLKKPLNHNVSACFDGNGHPVPRHDILKIEFLD